jgi:hypothetical protein
VVAMGGWAERDERDERDDGIQKERSLLRAVLLIHFLIFFKKKTTHHKNNRGGNVILVHLSTGNSGPEVYERCLVVLSFPSTVKTNPTMA